MTWDELVEFTNITDTSYDDDTVVPGQWYRYRVKAVDTDLSIESSYTDWVIEQALEGQFEIPKWHNVIEGFTSNQLPQHWSLQHNQYITFDDSKMRILANSFGPGFSTLVGSISSSSLFFEIPYPDFAFLDTNIIITLDSPDVSNTVMSITVEDGQFVLSSFWAGGFPSLVLSPTQHKYLRFSKTGNTLSIQTSPDASNWTTRSTRSQSDLDNCFLSIRFYREASSPETINQNSEFNWVKFNGINVLSDTRLGQFNISITDIVNWQEEDAPFSVFSRDLLEWGGSTTPESSFDITDLHTVSWGSTLTFGGIFEITESALIDIDVYKESKTSISITDAITLDFDVYRHSQSQYVVVSSDLVTIVGHTAFYRNIDVELTSITYVGDIVQEADVFHTIMPPIIDIEIQDVQPASISINIPTL